MNENFFKIPCPHCTVHIEFPAEILGQIYHCPQCGCSVSLVIPGHTPAAPPPGPKIQSLEKPATRARIKTKTEFAGSGCLVQGLGLLLLLLIFWFPFSTIAGLCLLIAGSQMSKRHYCGECRNPVANRGVKICPTCHSNFN